MGDLILVLSLASSFVMVRYDIDLIEVSVQLLEQLHQAESKGKTNDTWRDVLVS